MNASHTPSLIDETLVDRMVAGSLAPADLRKAVALLDQTPDGWKRLALGFLEEQAIGDALRADATAPRAPRRRLRPLALASAAAVAFALGWIGRELRPTGTRPPALVAAQPQLPPQIETVARAQTPAPVVFDPPAANPDSPALVPTVITATQLEAVERYLATQPSGIPERARYLLERDGYKIAEEREFVSQVLPDGRVIVAPVDRVQIQYAGNDPL